MSSGVSPASLAVGQKRRSESSFLRRSLQVPGLTDGHRGSSPQQQLQALAVVRQAAVMQRRASSGRLLVQVGAETRRHR